MTTINKIKEMKNTVKWTQWDKSGMFRCGNASWRDIEKWLREFGKEAYTLLHTSADAEIKHVVYARKIYDDEGCVAEVRFYTPEDSGYTEDEFENTSREVEKNSYIYAYHR